jgi:hypothetical protein
MGFSNLIARTFTDFRGKNTKITLADLIRGSVYSRLTGYEDGRSCGSTTSEARRCNGSKKARRRSRIMTRLSCHHCRSDVVRVCLSVLEYTMGNLWWRLALPRRIENWSPTSLQQWLVRTFGRLTKYARYCWLSRAEGHLQWQLFGQRLRRNALPVPSK